MTESEGHIYTKKYFRILTFFTQLQLQKRHSQFCHPSVSKLFNLLNHGRRNDPTPDTLASLHEI